MGQPGALDTVYISHNALSMDTAAPSPGFLNGLRDLTVAYRRRHRLNQVDLAEQLGVRQSAVSDWERGKTNLRGKALERLTDLLDCESPTWPGLAREAPADYHPEMEPSYWVEAADAFSELVRVLRSDLYDFRLKEERFAQTVSWWYDALQHIRSSREASKPKGDDS